MTVGRVIGLLVLVVVLYAVITQPVQSASAVRGGAGHLSDAGTSMTTFLSQLSGGGSTSSGTGQVDVAPTGGVATGDGSSRR